MTKRGGLDIGIHHFKSQKEALVFCSKLLNGYVDGQIVEKKEDIEFLTALVKRHPRAAEKIGPGIKRFYRDKAPKPNYGTSCFWTEQINGEKVRFSFKPCVTGKDD